MSNELGKFKLNADNAVLVVIDVQERLVPAMPQDVYLRLRDTVEMLVFGAGLLGVPVVTTEQYPKVSVTPFRSCQRLVKIPSLKKSALAVAVNQTFWMP